MLLKSVVIEIHSNWNKISKLISRHVKLDLEANYCDVTQPLREYGHAVQLSAGGQVNKQFASV